MAKSVTIHEAKTHLSRLIEELGTGAQREIVIMRGKKPAARLVPFAEQNERLLGIDRGLFVVPDDFDAPDEEITRLFEGDV